MRYPLIHSTNFDDKYFWTGERDEKYAMVTAFPAWDGPHPELHRMYSPAPTPASWSQQSVACPPCPGTLRAAHWAWAFLAPWDVQDYVTTKHCSFPLSLSTNRWNCLGVENDLGMSTYCLLAPKELYTWYCPMTIQHHPLFEHTPVLNNNFEYWCRDDFVDCDFYDD